MTAAQERAIAVMTRWYSAWDEHDVHAISAMVTDDATYEEPSLPGGIVRGRAAVLDAARALLTAVPDWRVEVGDISASQDGSVATGFWRCTGHVTAGFDPPGFAPTNQPIAFEGMFRSEVCGDQVSRLQAFYDLVGVGRQLGAFPPEGSLGDRLAVRMQHLKARGMRRRARRT